MKNKVFLIVDDEKDLREVIKDEIIFLGGQVLESENGLEALEVLKSNKVDLIITDGRMPKCDGLALIKKIQDDHKLKDIPIIFMSAYSNVFEDEIKELNIKNILTKPFELTKFVELVQTIIR